MIHDSFTDFSSSYVEANSALQAALLSFSSSASSVACANLDNISKATSLFADAIGRTAKSAISEDFSATLAAALSSFSVSIPQSAISASEQVMNKLINDFSVSYDQQCTSSTNSDDDYITLNQDTVKEYELPETIAIPIGHNRIKIKLEIFIAILALIWSIFTTFLPSSSDPNVRSFLNHQNQILTNILEDSEASNAKTIKELDALKQSVDEANSHLANIEQYLKENAESENIESTRK